MRVYCHGRDGRRAPRANSIQPAGAGATPGEELGVDAAGATGAAKDGVEGHPACSPQVMMT